MRTILQLVLIDETGDSYYRMRWPGQTLCAQDKNLRVINLDAQAKERLEWARTVDLLVLYQSNDLDLMPIIQERKENGLNTLVEYNDNFYAPPPASPVFTPWSSPLIWGTYETIMRKADHISVTGDGLKELFTGVASIPITILKNHLPEPPPKFDSVYEDSNILRIGWAGSVGHMADLMAILPILEDFCLSNENVQLCFMGNESIPSQLSIPNSKYNYTPWGSMADYYRFLEQLHIGIAPLANTPYNRCRSDIKALEYASRGALPIAQNLLPYQDLIKSGSIKSFSNGDDLIKLLKLYHQDRALLRKDTNHAFDVITAEREAIKNKERLELYLSLMPKAETRFQTDLPLGYHEIVGDRNSTLKTHLVCATAEKLLRAGSTQEGLEYIDKNKAQLSFDPQLNILYCEALRRVNHPETEKYLIYNIDSYPHDLRFLFLLLKTKKSASDKTGIWYNIIEKLELSPKSMASFFEKQCVSTFIADFPNLSGLLALTTSISDLYPSNIALLNSLSQQCFKIHAHKQSREYALRAIELLEMLERESNTPQDSLQLLRTIAEACEYARSL